MSQIWKTIPLFISSTFRGMYAERDQLNHVVFPAIEERLKPRDAAFPFSEHERIIPIPNQTV